MDLPQRAAHPRYDHTDPLVHATQNALISADEYDLNPQDGQPPGKATESPAR
jgi:hypothetical protein